MFLSLETTNFRKLRSEKFDFTSGLNAVRGLNERGKSTLFEAMAYAMFGSDALREPLADVVTWGEKLSSLKVKLRLKINTNEVEIRRGKSGAEIDVDGKLAATGQTEVTRFVEGLLGTPPKVAAKLMLANQASLRGALADGPTATAQLIEQLSNFALIDEIIQLVQEKLPTGNSVAVEQQIKTFSEQLEATVVQDLNLSGPQGLVAEAEATLAKERAELAAATAELAPAKAAADAARAQFQALNAAKAAVVAQTQAQTQATASIAVLDPVSKATAEEVARLQSLVADSREAAAADRALSSLKSLTRPETEWEGDRASFEAEMAKARQSVKVSAQAVQDLRVQAATLESKVIKETSCALCGKDLKDVPEVVKANNATWGVLASTREKLESEEHVLAGLRADVQAYEEIEQAERSFVKAYGAAAKYIEVIDDAVPAHWKWVGINTSQALYGGADKLLSEAQAEIRRADRDAGQLTALQAQLAKAQAALATAQAEVDRLGPLVAADRSTGLETDLQTKIRYHEGRIQELMHKIASLQQEMQAARNLHAAQLANRATLQKSFDLAKSQLEELNLNNILLKKLRGARPKVADKLWSIVLSTVSYYFSAVRGVQSAVTRDDAGFKVDGKPVPGLSGSTLDALGLAIRIALTKTFLPNNDFLILDEPAAACDDEREMNMLGVITTAGFDQVLLVTHSPLADAFADKVITL